MPNEFVARNGIIALANSIVTGSVTATQGFTGSLFGTASWANNATTSSYILNAASASFATSAASATSASIAANAVTASHALNAVTASRALNANTASYANFAITASIADNAVTASRALNANTASFATQAANASSASFATSAASATTASYANFANTASSADNFNVRNTLTATTIVVQTITSSVSFMTGSTKFGTIITNTHQFTGSVGVTGSITVIDGVTNNLTASWANRAISASIADNAVTASRALNANSASFVLNAVSASFATSAASATSASFATSAANATSASFATNAANAFVQNGNSFGAAALLGTNDAQNLQFETNGTVRMTITGSDGNVGIGTTSPQARLHIGPVNGDTAAHLYLASSNNSFGWRIDTQDSGAGVVPLRIWRRTGGSDTQVITVNNADGNVGIGTTSPSEKLHVASGCIFIDGEGGGLIVDNGSKRVGFMKYGGHEGVISRIAGQDFGIVRVGTSNIKDVTGITYDVYVGSDGNVGIGTTSPISRLTVASTGESVISVQDLDGTNQYLNLGHNGGDSYFLTRNGSSNGNFIWYTSDGTTTSERMRLTATGNVGIGTTSPNYRLQVAPSATFGNAEDGNISIWAAAAGGTVTSPTTVGGIIFGDGNVTNSYLGRIAVVQDNPAASTTSHLRFYTNSGGGNGTTAERVRITGGGNVGIGTTSPSNKFQVHNGTYGVGFDFQSTVPEIRASVVLRVYQRMEVWGSGDGYYMDVRDSSGNPQVYFSGASANNYINSGNVGIGTTSPSAKLQVIGNAIIGQSSNNSTNASLDITAGGSGFNSIIDFGYWDTFDAAIWLMGYFGVDGGQFKIKDSNSGIPYDRMVIAGTSITFPSSSIGIGTTSPVSARLQIIAAGSGIVHEKNSGGYFIGTGFNSNNGYLSYYTQDNFILGYSSLTGTAPSVNTLTLTTGGSVGIGITAPQAPLHVIASSSADNALIQEWSYTAANADVYSLMLKQTVTSGVVRYNFSMVNNSTSYNDVLVLDRGNVGIGTTSPLVRLDVRGTAIITNQAGNNYDENLRLPEATSGYAALTLGGAIAASGATAAQWTFVKWPTTNAFSIQNNTNNLLWIQTNGNVGIGTTAPGARLTVAGQGTGQALIGDAGFGTTNYTGISLNGTLSTSAYNILSSPTDQSLYINRPSGVSIHFRANNTDQAIINSAGNVGIGTTAPAQILDVNGSAQYNLGNSGFIKLLSGATQRHGFIQSAFSNFLFSNNIYYDGGNWRYDQNGFGAQVQTETLSAGVITFNTAASGTAGNVVTLNERMRITNGGNVYVGGTSLASDAKFGVSNANAEGIEFSPNISSNVTRMLSYNRSTNVYITSRMVASTFEWQISGADAMRLTSGGELWINYTTDQGAYYLQVNGDVYAGAYFQSSDIRLKNILNKYDSNSFGAIEYKWKDGRDNKVHWGYTAQDAIKFIPDAVNENKDGYYTIDYHQAHTYKIAMLEKEIAELKQKLNLS